jgi:opacity protein-like surface antigen
LGGARYDKIESNDNWSFGFELGGGVDIGTGSSVYIRIGVDYQMFFDEGDDLKVLRANAGLSF